MHILCVLATGGVSEASEASGMSEAGETTEASGATRRTGAWGGDSVFIKLARLRQGVTPTLDGRKCSVRRPA
jgi:hypothetical protein